MTGIAFRLSLKLMAAEKGRDPANVLAERLLGRDPRLGVAKSP